MNRPPQLLIRGGRFRVGIRGWGGCLPASHVNLPSPEAVAPHSVASHFRRFRRCDTDLRGAWTSGCGLGGLGGWVGVGPWGPCLVLRGWFWVGRLALGVWVVGHRLFPLKGRAFPMENNKQAAHSAALSLGTLELFTNLHFAKYLANLLLPSTEVPPTPDLDFEARQRPPALGRTSACVLQGLTDDRRLRP